MTLLDTHAWVWWASESPKLSSPARAAIAGASRLGVCAISAWEVAMLVAHGRLVFDRDPLEWIGQALALPRVELVPLTPEVAVASTRLGREFHNDPADQIIAATAKLRRAQLVTRDGRIREWGGVACVW